MGRALVMGLATEHEVTVLSRNPFTIEGVERWVGDRLESLPQVPGNHFDLVIDFIAYDDQGLEIILPKTPHYLAISSLWLCRGYGVRADQSVEACAPFASADLPDVTVNYLQGKRKLENALLSSEWSRTGVIRFPILWGRDDHTARLTYYRDRILSNQPCYLTPEAQSSAQILWSEDAVRVLIGAISCRLSSLEGIWEALTDSQGLLVREWIELIGKAVGRDPIFKTLASTEGEELLEEDPLFREKVVEKSPHNLFDLMGFTPTPPAEWLRKSLVEEDRD